jgi:hypothetical protein
MKKVIIFWFGLFILAGGVCCSSSFPLLGDLNDRQTNNFPRESILRLQHNVMLQVCYTVDGKKNCSSSPAKFAGTGSVIHRNAVFGVVYTAAHVCKVELPPVPPEVTLEIISSNIVATDIYGVEYLLKYLVSDPKTDQCIMVSTVPMNLRAIPISSIPPREGEKVYTLGYPLGLYAKNVVFIADGYFLGQWTKSQAAYNLIAKPGSSGSPIVNSRGELIGLIHSGLVRMEQFMFSPPYSLLCSFINKALGI